MKNISFRHILFAVTLPCIVSCDFQNETRVNVFDQACMANAKPIISVSDFNADGIVDDSDIQELQNSLGKDVFYTLYERNLDGFLDDKDLQLAKSELGQSSTALDRAIVELVKQTQYLQEADSRPKLRDLGFTHSVDSLAGHGEHWTSEKGDKLIEEGGAIMFEEAVGFNIPKGSGRVWALFWGLKGDLVFANGATDYPLPGGEWETQQVVSFSNVPPSFTGHESEIWHTHAGLCSAPQERNGEVHTEFSQHETYAQCQQRKSAARTLGYKNGWQNLWMLHAWVFVPNPNGLFANTHPCIDPDSPSEELLNGDRNVPPFFRHHH